MQSISNTNLIGDQTVIREESVVKEATNESLKNANESLLSESKMQPNTIDVGYEHSAKNELVSKIDAHSKNNDVLSSQGRASSVVNHSAAGVQRRANNSQIPNIIQQARLEDLRARGPQDVRIRKFNKLSSVSTGARTDLRNKLRPVETPVPESSGEGKIKYKDYLLEMRARRLVSKKTGQSSQGSPKEPFKQNQKMVESYLRDSKMNDFQRMEAVKR